MTEQRPSSPKGEIPKAVEVKPMEGKGNEPSQRVDAGMILNYAALLVAVITGIFAIFGGIFTVADWYRYKTLKEELTAQGTELKQQRVDLQTRIETFKSELLAQEQRLATERKQERLDLQARIETFKPELVSQEQRLAANRRFLEAVIAHYSMLLVGIVKGFGTALNPDEARTLSSLIFEAEAALDLFYPDEHEVPKALLRLEQVGSHGSVSSLVQLRDDRTVDPEIRIRAQQVLTKVKDRLKKERESPPLTANEKLT